MNQLRQELKNQGYVYLIKGEFGRYKIGASKNPIARLKQLRISSSQDHKLIATIREEDMYLTESDIHDIFEKYRVHSEWFELDEDAFEYFLKIAEIEDELYEKMKVEYGNCLKLEKIEIKGNI